mgnify:CR=1 FL=1
MYHGSRRGSTEPPVAAAALRGELEKVARKAFPGVKVVGRVVQAAEAKGDQRLVVL